MVTINHIKHKPVGSNAPQMIQKMGKCSNPENRRRWWWWGCGLQHIKNADSHSSCFPRLSSTGRDTATSRLLATLMSLSPTSKWGLFAKEAALDSGISLFCTLKWNTVLGLAFPPLIGGKLRKYHGKLLVSLCQRPVYMAIKASITRRNHVPETVKKWKLWSPNFTTLPGCRIKSLLKYELSYQLIQTQHCPEYHESW